ncbi:hypothetical protein WAI453_006502 [Rhynchosporium graminicola]
MNNFFAFESPPLIPPATEKKALTTIPQILAEVRRHKDGSSLRVAENSIQCPLEEHQYGNLQRQLRKANLWDVTNINFDTTTFLSQITTSFKCPVQFTKASYIILHKRFYTSCMQLLTAIVLRRGLQYPGVIVELSYSPKKKDLSRLADAYILESDADIRVVIGIDVKYKGISDQLFRDEAERLVPDSQASL